MLLMVSYKMGNFYKNKKKYSLLVKKCIKKVREKVGMYSMENTLKNWPKRRRLPLGQTLLANSPQCSGLENIEFVFIYRM